MKRTILFWVVGLTLITTSVFAQTPKVSVELDNTETVVGQPVLLRIKVLVPTWMPKPPVFPNLEVPSLMVRLPQKASGPVSEKIEGETWSGVQRSYRLYPLAGGKFELPEGEIEITYTEPGNPDPKEFSANLSGITFEASVPAEASQLSPMIIASGFSLDQSVEGETKLAAGDAVTRTITASIEGTTPVLIPSLSTKTDGSTLREYPKEPTINEVENRGVLSGTRIESTTYVGLSAGTPTLPEISFQWFNLETGKLEKVSLPAVDLVISDAPGAPAKPLDPLQTAGLVLQILLVVAVFWAILRFLGPRVSAFISAVWIKWQNSEPAAHREVMKKFKHQDLSGVMSAYADWAGFFPNRADSDNSAVSESLMRIGSARFGRSDQPENKRDWIIAREIYVETRRQALITRKKHSAHDVLPPLNP